MLSEQELIDKINKLDEEINHTKSLVSEYKKKFSETETNLIGYKIDRSIYQEKLRVLQAEKVPTDLSDSEIEIAEFRKKYPELCEKGN